MVVSERLVGSPSEVLRPWRAGLFSGDSEALTLLVRLNFEAIADSYIAHICIFLSIG